MGFKIHGRGSFWVTRGAGSGIRSRFFISYIAAYHRTIMPAAQNVAHNRHILHPGGYIKLSKYPGIHDSDEPRRARSDATLIHCTPVRSQMGRMELSRRDPSRKQLVELIDVSMCRLGDEEVCPHRPDYTDAKEDPAYFAFEIGFVGVDKVGQDDLGGTWIRSAYQLRLSLQQPAPEHKTWTAWARYTPGGLDSPTEKLCTVNPNPTVLLLSFADPSSPHSA